MTLKAPDGFLRGREGERGLELGFKGSKCLFNLDNNVSTGVEEPKEGGWAPFSRITVTEGGALGTHPETQHGEVASTCKKDMIDCDWIEWIG